MAQLLDIKAVQNFTITGNTETDKDLASIAELQVKKIIKNSLLQMGMRSKTIAKQMEKVMGVGTGIIRIPSRNNVGHDYDFDSGTKKRRTKASYTTIPLNQITTAKVVWEQFDTERYLASTPAVRATLVGEWIDSIFISFYASQEAIFLRGVIDYAIAKGQYTVLPMKSLDNTEDARKAYFTIKKQIIKMNKTINDKMIGNNPQDVLFGVGMEQHLGLIHAHIADSGTEVTHSTLANGTLFDNKILGTQVQESFFLDTKFEKEMIDNDLAFDFTNIGGILVHDEAVANPTGFEMNKIVEDNETLNPKFILKAMGTLPQVIRPELVHLFVEVAPTEERIEQAKANKWDGNTYQYENSYTVATFDSIPETPVDPEARKTKSTK